MTYVENKRKELKTKYYADTPNKGVEQGLLPQGLLGLKTTVPKNARIGFK